MRHPEAVEKLAILNCPHPNRFLRGLWSPRQLRKSWYMCALQVPGRFVQESIYTWFTSNFERTLCAREHSPTKISGATPRR
jgi:epoxide hydrolase 4